jgi:predicted RNA binding protein YcfA (HicA-like mRNA interferase family)
LPSSPLPAVSGTKLISALASAGFTVTRISGSHHRLKHRDGRATTVPVHAGQDVPKGTLHAILRDIGMSIDELRKFL